MKKIAFTLAMVFAAQNALPCLIFLVTDGTHVFVGNHEDWYERDARINFVQASTAGFGYVAFDFASEGLIQGGMNSPGLFFDGTATPYAPLDGNSKPEFKGDFWVTLLRKCRNVGEAMAFINSYKVTELEKVHIFLADRSGQSVVIGVFDGKLQYHKRSGPYQVLTNFNLNDPEYGGELPCPRFAKANEILTAKGDATMETVMEVLKNTTQGDLTIYSNIYDLTAGQVTVYSLHDFSKPLTYDLKAELAKGAHSFILSNEIKK